MIRMLVVLFLTIFTFASTSFTTLEDCLASNKSASKCASIIGRGKERRRLMGEWISERKCCKCDYKEEENFQHQLLSLAHVSNNRAYIYNSNPLTWDEALEKCEQLGGSLLHTDVGDVVSRSQTLKGLQITRDYIWLGLSDSRNEGRWVWVNGTSLADDDEMNFGWGRSQPNGGRSENCALLYTVSMEEGGGDDEFRIYDYKCQSYRTYPSICEFDLQYFHNIYLF